MILINHNLNTRQHQHNQLNRFSISKDKDIEKRRYSRNYHQSNHPKRFNCSDCSEGDRGGGSSIETFLLLQLNLKDQRKIKEEHRNFVNVIFEFLIVSLQTKEIFLKLIAGKILLSITIMLAIWLTYCQALVGWRVKPDPGD